MDQETQNTHEGTENTPPIPHMEEVEEMVEAELAPLYPAGEDALYPDEPSAEFELELAHFDPEKQEDQIWKARTGLNEETLCGAIETIVFMSDRPVALQKIKNMIDEDLPLRVLHTAIARLQEEYEKKHHGLRLAEVAEGYQFRTKATYAKYVQDLFKVNKLELSPTALEVLAIIAYKQPVAKTEVEKIRGVDSSHIVRALMDKRLVKVAGRSEDVGRPVLYATTPEFLEVFNLPDLGSLPPEHELETMVEDGIGKIEDIKGIVSLGDKERFVFDEIDELDQLAETIKSINPETDFTLSLKVEDKKRTSSEGEVVKTAFDLLEEFVNNKQVSNENLAACASEMISAFIDPSVISDLEAGPFNVPTDEDEDFQMIDLDTGEAIEFDEDLLEEELEAGELDVVVDLEEDLEEASGDMMELAAHEEEQEEAPLIPVSEDKNDFKDQYEVESEELISLLGDSDEEADNLSRALDEAFERLTGEKLLDEEGEVFKAADEDDLEELERRLSEMGDDAAEAAEDLDLDLSWLKSNNNEDLDGEGDFTEDN